MITIAIPLYNTEKHIYECIQSVLSQTFQDIEILVINDCCTDYSIEIVKSIIQEKDSPIQIRIINQEKNQGVALARNRAIQEAKGQYIYFLDSDDMLTPDCIETLYSAHKNKKLDFVVGSYAYAHESELPTLHDAIHEYCEVNNNLEFFNYKYAYTKNSLFTIYIWNIMFSIDFLRTNHLLFQPHRKGEDHIFFLEMMPFIKKCTILPHVTYHYILHENSLSNYKNRDSIPAQEITDSINRLKQELEIVKCWKQNPYYPEIIFQQIRDAIWMLLSIMRKEQLIKPSLPQNSIEFLCSHPLLLSEIILLKRKRTFHIVFYFFGKLPLGIKKHIIRLFLKLKR